MTTTCNAILRGYTSYTCERPAGHYNKLDVNAWHHFYDPKKVDPIVWSDDALGAGYAAQGDTAAVPVQKPNKQIEVWFRTSGWGIPRKVGIADLGADAPSTFRNLAGLLRKLADLIAPLGGKSNGAE